MNPIFKVVLDLLHRGADREREEQARRAAASPEEGGEPRRCPVCKARAGEQDTECPSCGARLD